MAAGSGDEAGDAGGASWRLIGPASELSEKRCRLMYSPLGHDADVCLFYVKGEFFAMDARCAHSGGPLCEGDIEEADGVLQVFCPWHDYNFDLRTGKSGTTLEEGAFDAQDVPPCEFLFCPVAQQLVFLPALAFFHLVISFYQQQVYEVKLEDGNVYVKHAGHLSLKPFPADQKT
ncbi:Rieske domain-containing protein isoform X2 [Kryptolebias marmoratus]|uniref:Rieske domain-containing protein isoform X2 n=1 Tax=Kryptolebias marmoratus TaxID=37003 RepID=UPI0007F8E663|nr:Rieske domain-containing protein isoform X2 [Kryptolebias marmoratus]